jgi:hypothetical protein
MRTARVLVLLNVVFAVRHVPGFVAPGRPSQPALYALLVGAEFFNMLQGSGFWWTLWSAKRRAPLRPWRDCPPVDIFIPTVNEPVEIVEPTVVRHAFARCRGADRHHRKIGTIDVDASEFRRRSFRSSRRRRSLRGTTATARDQQ